LVAAIQSTGRDAILRGSGAPNSAAVCILETFSSTVRDPVRGLARMVQVAEQLTLVDLTVRGLAPGKYFATIRQAGDISEGPESVGEVWEAASAAAAAKREGGGGVGRGVLGVVEVDANGSGGVFLDKPVQIWEVIGRSMIVSRKQEGRFSKEDGNTLVGVIARSAGVWDNDKTVCSCSGKTVWEERKEQVDRGML
jgi:copper chaperone for superoxide dismutase